MKRVIIYRYGLIYVVIRKNGVACTIRRKGPPAFFYGPLGPAPAIRNGLSVHARASLDFNHDAPIINALFFTGVNWIIVSAHTHGNDSHASGRRLRRAVFLDRDGVINAKLQNAYVTQPSEFQFLEGVFEALSTLRELGFLLIVVTNQRGIARGIMSEEDLRKVHSFMISRLKEHNIELDDIDYCPHEKYELCPCRKPRPLMLLRKARKHCICLPSSYMVGDSPSDIEAGRNAGVRTVRIAREPDPSAHLTFPTLLRFARFLRAIRKT
jgi:D-glycero-D-manno-heptose 1,7-bisphosphate phosphatase